MEVWLNKYDAHLYNIFLNLFLLNDMQRQSNTQFCRQPGKNEIKKKKRDIEKNEHQE